MRFVALVGLVACGLGYRPDDAAEDTLCVTSEGVEVCAPAAATRTDDGGAVRFVVTAAATVPGVDFGWEAAEARVEGTLPVGFEAPGEIDALVGVVAARVTCVVDDAHGDHCHLGVPYDRACELEIGEVRRVVVDRFDEAGLTLRFAATSTADVPSCCVSTCAEAGRDPWTEPELPYALAGVVDVAWGG